MLLPTTSPGAKASRLCICHPRRFELFAKTHPKVRGELLYFPTRMDPSLNMMANDRQRKGKMTILVGNSGDRSNEHIAALRAVHQQFGDTVKVVSVDGISA